MSELRQRRPRVRCEPFLRFVREQMCCVCGARPRSEAAHLRGACPERGKRETGMGEKPDDRWAVPLCRDCHRDDMHALHRTSERWFFENNRVDPFAVAAELYSEWEAR